jgi:hypothetical protein
MFIFDRNLDVLCTLVCKNVVTFCVGLLTKRATALLPLLHECHVMSLSLSVPVKCIQLNTGVGVQYFGKSMPGGKDVA